MAEAEAIVIGRHPHHEDDEDDNPNNRTVPPPPPARMTTAAAAEAPARDGRSAMQIYGLAERYHVPYMLIPVWLQTHNAGAYNRPNGLFFFLFFFLADLSYVGFVLVSDFWDISDRPKINPLRWIYF
jgi:hypothetical protein